MTPSRQRGGRRLPVVLFIGNAHQGSQPRCESLTPSLTQVENGAYVRGAGIPPASTCSAAAAGSCPSAGHRGRRTRASLAGAVTITGCAPPCPATASASSRPMSVDGAQEGLHRVQERLGLLDVRHMARLLEDHPLRARNALVDLPDDERGRLVVSAGDKEGRCRDLREASPVLVSRRAELAAENDTAASDAVAEVR
jgi:hypothetical protein